jgi:hypothetical protein
MCINSAWPMRLACFDLQEAPMSYQVQEYLTG